MIINRNSEVICWCTIFLNNHPIAKITGFKRNIPPYNIVKCIRLVVRNTHPDTWRASLLFKLLNLFLCQIPMGSGILWNLSFGTLFFTLLLQFFFGHIAFVGQSSFQQIINIFLVDIEPLHLTVRTIITTDISTFIPLNAEPFQILHLTLFPASDISLGIGIFNPYNKLSVKMFRI